MAKKRTLKTFTLVGDILYPGRVKVQAYTRAEAVRNAKSGDFTVYDKQSDCLAFDWNGDVDSVEESDA